MIERRTFVLTALAMLAFAANSLLCRAALQQASIDPASFASVRLASGAAMLSLLMRWRSTDAGAQATDWLAVLMLWLYVAGFSFAYLTLSAGTGALILFGAVQLTMFGAGLRAGERFAPQAWIGLGLALAGLLYLVAPGVAAPAPLGALLMGVAGAAWGVYSLRGRRASGNPLASTARNFLYATPLALLMSLLLQGQLQLQAQGLLLGMASGALSSGLGYVLWYAALPGLGALRAASVQLLVPPLAALGGALLLAELPTLRLALASLAILGGVALVLLSRARLA